MDSRVALAGRPRERCLGSDRYRELLVAAALSSGKLQTAELDAIASDPDFAERIKNHPVATYPPRMPLDVIEERQAKCKPCPHRAGDTCLKQKEKKPDRSAAISVGVTMPSAHCPIGEWDRWTG